MGDQKQEGDDNIQVGKNLTIIIISSVSVLFVLLLLLLPLPAIYEVSGFKYAIERFQATRTVREHLDQNQLEAAKTLLDQYLPIYRENPELHAQKVRYLMMSRELIWDFEQQTQNEVFEHSQSAIQLNNNLNSYLAEVLVENSLTAIEVEANRGYPVAFADLDFVTGDFWGKRLPFNFLISLAFFSPLYSLNPDVDVASGFAGGGWVKYISAASEYDLTTTRQFVPRLEKLVDKFLQDGHFTSATFVGVLATRIDSNRDTQAMFNKGLEILQQVVEHTRTNPKRVNVARKAYEAFSQSFSNPINSEQIETNKILKSIDRQLIKIALIEQQNLSSDIREGEEYKQCVRHLQVSSTDTNFSSQVKKSLENCLGTSFLEKAEQLASVGKLEQAIEEIRKIPEEANAKLNANQLINKWSNTLRQEAEARQLAKERYAKQEQLKVVQAERSQSEARLREAQKKRTQVENQIKDLWNKHYQELPFHRNKVSIGGYDAATGRLVPYNELHQRVRTSQLEEQQQVQQLKVELEPQLKPLIQQGETLLAEIKNLQQQLRKQRDSEKNLEKQLESLKVDGAVLLPVSTSRAKNLSH
ncbi:MAG: hypothetical protein F6K31_27040 [Symploca sp. SIO2G7]|nr:hypothetical protein [Symploca sp. SIO2G7]